VAARSYVTRRTRRAGATLVAPPAVFFVGFNVLPVLAVVGLAFSSWSGFNVHDVTYTGLSNFRELRHDDLFVRSLLHTVAFVALSTLALNVLGFSLAMLINSRVQGHDFLRIAMFVPLGLSPVITGVIWQQLLGPYGLVNSALGSLHLISSPVQFLGDPNLAFWTVIAAAIWQYSGYNMLLYYSGLQSLPRERLEAASIDGAGAVARFRHIIVPYMRPVIAVVIVLNLIGGWKVFELVYVLTNGGPNHGTEVLSTYLYQQAFTISANGYASAIALVVVVLDSISRINRRGLHAGARKSADT
jgi:raffinose/stachyose/melibiose transport system permease protein